MLLLVLTLVLAACSPSAATPPAQETAVQPQAGSHPPVILRVEQRQEIINGSAVLFEDIHFLDPEGDVVAATYQVTSFSPGFSLVFADALVDVPVEQQKAGAIFTEVTGCWQRLELVYQVRLQDQAGNLSEPVQVSLSCTTPPQVDSAALLSSGLIVLLPAGVVLLLVFLFLFRRLPGERLPALRSTLMFVLIFMTVYFFQGVLHEGGHSLFLLGGGIPVTLYVHPFFFSGFSRPIIPASGALYDILGSVTSLLLSLAVSFSVWKRRSPALLPFVFLFPYSALGDGFNVMGFMGDFQNVVQKTGLPAILFLLPGALIFCIGILSFLSLLPLFGLDPNGNKALFVIPAAMWTISCLSLAVAHVFVPGSPIDLEYFAGREILLSVNNFLFLYIGIVLAILYVTVFRRLYPRLPAWLRTDSVELTWKDLRLPALLWACTVAIGLIVVI
jgi:hypothetical protein